MAKTGGNKGKKSTSSARPAASSARGGTLKKSATRSSRLKPIAPASAESAAPRARFPKSFSSFSAASEWLHDRINVEKSRLSQLTPDTFKLSRMRALMDALGEPHRAFRSVHVAGSKGKGSTCEMTAACLRGCGLTTGLYTSPHVVDIRERIRVGAGAANAGDGMISETAFTALLGKCSTASEKIAREFGEPTFFELLTAVGFLHFAEEAVDVAVVEVGLGGRLDATNVLVPDVCGVTAIQMEHKELLGDTLEKIAREKAGIFKPGVPAITFPQAPSIMNVFKEVAAEVGCPLLVLGQDVDFTSRFEANAELGPHMRVCISSPRSNFEHLPVPLKGEHQAFNAGLALAMIDQLRAKGLQTPEVKVAAGLARTPNPARLEQIWDRPRIVIDGAHNPESIHALVKSLGAHVKYDSLVVIFGCAADKDIGGMLQKIALGADKVIFTRAADTPRAVDPRELLRKFGEVSPKMAQVAPDLKTALNTAARAVARDDLICVTGSFYLAGEAKRLLLEKQKAEPAKVGAGSSSQRAMREAPAPAVVHGRIVETTPAPKRAKAKK